MNLSHMEPKPFSDGDDSTVYTALTPPETDITENIDEPNAIENGSVQRIYSPPSSSSVPWPGSTFIIRSISTGEVITLLRGSVILARPGGPGSIHWDCIDTKGWIGFRNISSGNMLGHNIHGNLICDVNNHNGWENFCVRMRPEEIGGGYALLMTHWERLWQVGFVGKQGMLAKVPEGSENIVAWEFTKV